LVSNIESENVDLNISAYPLSGAAVASGFCALSEAPVVLSKTVAFVWFLGRAATDNLEEAAGALVTGAGVESKYFAKLSTGPVGTEAAASAGTGATALVDFANANAPIGTSGYLANTI